MNLRKEKGIKQSKEEMEQTSGIKIGRADQERLVNIISQSGSTTKQAIQILENAFNKATDKENYVVDGSKIVRSIIDELNDRACKNATSGGQEGVMKTKSDNKLTTFDEFSMEDTKWGAFLNKYYAKARDIKNLLHEVDYWRDQLSIAEANKDRTDINEAQRNKYAKTYETAVRRIPVIEAAIDGEFYLTNNLLVLYGVGSSGKSAFAEAVAKELGFSFYETNVSMAQEKWVGSTGDNTNRLLKTLSELTYSVVRLDELDTQLPSGQGESNNPAAAQQVGLLLNFINENEADFKRRRVFIVGTTNNPEKLREQFASRFTYQQAEQIRTPAGMKKIIERSVEQLKKRSMTADGKEICLMPNCGETAEANAYLTDLWSKIDHAQVAKVLTDRSVGEIPVPRSLNKEWISTLLDAHSNWKKFTERSKLFYSGDWANYEIIYSSDGMRLMNDGSGDKIYILPEESGYELNTENVVRSASFMQLNKNDKGQTLEGSFCNGAMVLDHTLNAGKQPVVVRVTNDNKVIVEHGNPKQLPVGWVMRESPPQAPKDVGEDAETDSSQQASLDPAQDEFLEMQDDDLEPIFPPEQEPVDQQPFSSIPSVDGEGEEKSPASPADGATQPNSSKKKVKKSVSSTDYYFNALKSQGFIKDEVRHAAKKNTVKKDKPEKDNKTKAINPCQYPQNYGNFVMMEADASIPEWAERLFLK
jgi:hypothetical protein